MEMQNSKLKYKVALYKAIIVVVIMIHLPSHSTSVVVTVPSIEGKSVENR